MDFNRCANDLCIKRVFYPKKCCSQPCYKKSYLQLIPGRFWKKVQKTDLISCWPWLGSVGASGYGTIFLYPNIWGRTHRVAYEIEHGEITDDLFVCHTCDNRLCCNSTHLFLGTNSDNMIDALKKGRTTQTKLSVAQVQEIYALKGVSKSRAVAQKFDIGILAVQRIWVNRAWKFVEKTPS